MVTISELMDANKKTGYRITIEKITGEPETSAYYTSMVSCSTLGGKGTVEFPSRVSETEYILLSEALIAIRSLERATMPSDGEK